MATRYVGIGGNDGNSGLTWALRKLTLNGAEDTPVVAGDTVYVGPGVYREKLDVDVSGGAGTPITYIGDVTGNNTDSVGGIVRITGSDNDQTNTRNACVSFNGAQRAYRTFRGFMMDMSTGRLIDGGLAGASVGNSIIIEDCKFETSATDAIYFTGANQINGIIRRCVFINRYFFNSILIFHAANVDDTNHLIENCIFLGPSRGYSIRTDNIGDVTVKNCLFMCADTGVRNNADPTAGQTINVYNSIFYGLTFAVSSVTLGFLVENYNTFFGNNADRTNVNVGANSLTYPPLLLPPILYSGVGQVSGFKFPWWFGELSEWSQVQAITGSSEPTEDLLGIARPVTASKNSWGPIQFPDMERETGTVRTGSVSMVLHDAGRHQIWVPVEASSTTIKIYVYREANYAGNLPQMIIKQPGVADDVTTDVGAAGGWNLLTTTLVPAAIPPYVVVELVSRNTAVALAYEVFFDDLDVS